MCLSYRTALLVILLFFDIIGNAQISEEAFYLKQDSLRRIRNLFPGSISTNNQKSTDQKVLNRPSLLLSNNQDNAICAINSGRLHLIGQDASLWSYATTLTASNHVLIVGVLDQNIPDNVYACFIMKTDLDGNVIWSKAFDSIGTSVMYDASSFSRVVELADGSILAAGQTTNPQTQNDDVLVMKLSSSGTLIWTKVFKSRFWTFGNGSPDYFWIQDMKEDPYTGDLFLCGPHWTVGRAMIKIDTNTGNIIWSNGYDYSQTSFDFPFGFEIKENEIRYFGRFLNSIGQTVINIIRINKQTGDTLSTRCFTLSHPAGNKAAIIGVNDFVITNNGHYLMSGTCFGYTEFPWNGVNPLYQGTVIEFDSSLNFLKATVFRSAVESNHSNSKVSVFADGSGMLTYLKPAGGFTGTIYHTQFKNGSITKSRKRQFVNEAYVAENFFIKLPDGNDLRVRALGDDINQRVVGDFCKYHVADTSDCLGEDEYGTFAEQVNYVPTNWLMTNIYQNDFFESTQKTFETSNTVVTTVPVCVQQSSCDTIKLIANNTVTCPGQPVTITIRKNIGCGSRVPLNFDTTALSSIVHPNDSTYVLTFGQQWSGYVYGSILGCELHIDSVFVNILQAPAQLDLGADTVICPSNTILLNAHAGYASYTWQDGSGDSTYTVTQPGMYYVTVSNACGGIYSDTVIVNDHPPIFMSIGPDRSKCNIDTLQLHAPPGFINYAWSPNYFINDTTLQNVIVSPSIDTLYTLKAEKTPGCFAFDTVRISVYHSAPVDLGPDTSFCTGNSLLLDAGTGFSSYSWSNGSTSQQLIVQNPGLYSVIATTVNGCKSYDTLRVTNVYPLPVITLDSRTQLCNGEERILQAGNGFVSYNWTTGEQTSSIIISSIGTYSVTVTDSHGCEGSGTTVINELLPSPSGFLGVDTVICSYGSLTLQPLSSFDSYQWSTGSVHLSISVNQPGIYWLGVTDHNNCFGTDSIIVHPKECLKGFFAPSGFTPNNDGKNDVFKPILLGDVKKYEFIVYNRWGQVIFRTKSFTQGWNGSWKGGIQDSNVFVWTCFYQFEGESEKFEKGTVMLIR